MEITRLRWIDLFTNHSITRKGTGNPVSSCTATSSPMGTMDDDVLSENVVFDCRYIGYSPGPTGPWLRELSDELMLVRNRLRHLLSKMEESRRDSRQDMNTGESHVAARATYQEFIRLTRSPTGWQDIHADDRSLAERAELLLRMPS